MNFMSYEHLVEECPTIPVVRKCLDHPNFLWKPQPPQDKQHAQAPQQASNLEQAMANLSKVMGDFVGAQKSINAHLGQRIDSVESARKGNFPSQPYQNSKGIHEVEAKKGESSMVKEVKMVITLSGGNAKMMKEKEEKREFWPLVLLPLSGHIWSTFSSPFYTYYIPFRSLGSQESNASNGVQIGVETKKLWSLQENWTELSGNFAHLNPRCEKFRTVRNSSWHTSAISHTPSQFSHRANQGAKISHTTIQGAKFIPRCENLSPKVISFAHLNPRCENFAPCESRCETTSWHTDNCAKLNGNVAAAPHFATVGHVFEALSGAQIVHTICHFEAWEVRNPILQTVSDLDLKRRSYGCLKADYAKLSENFAP
ncbi:hypothetical protein AAG906_033327 [Vitis piasezkii]